MTGFSLSVSLLHDLGSAGPAPSIARRSPKAGSAVAAVP